MDGMENSSKQAGGSMGNVTRLAPPGRDPGIGDHLAGGSHASPGMVERIMEQEAIRRFVRSIAQRHPVSDSGHRDDVWAQVEDVCSQMRTPASSTTELETCILALRDALTAPREHAMTTSDRAFTAGSMRIAARRRRLRVTCDTRRGRRTMDFRLDPDGAVRIGDHAAER